VSVEAPPRTPEQDELDALIEEARRRARRRRLGYAAVVVALVAAAGGIYLAFGGGDGGGGATLHGNAAPGRGAAPGSSRPDSGSKPGYTDRNCTRAGEIAHDALFVCFRGNEGDHGTFILGDPDSNRVLPVGLPPLPGDHPVGRWSWAAVAPSGDTVLLQWSAECEVPITFLVGAGGGAPKAIKGLSPAGQSFALGWTPSGRAFVVAKSGGCGGSSPRLLEVSESGAILKHWTLTEREAAALEPSIAPRAVGELLP
jgi:hypothetical protein